MKQIAVWLWFLILAGLLAGCGMQPDPFPYGENESREQNVETVSESESVKESADELRNRLETEYGELAVHLIALLENEEQQVYNPEDQSFGYEMAPYPDRTSIPASYHFGLFDLTGDGVPELLCAMWGYSGSMGNARYAIYDVLAETKMAELPASYGQPLARYRNKEDGTVHFIGTRHLQMGVSDQFEDLVEWSFDPETAAFEVRHIYGTEVVFRPEDIGGEHPMRIYSVSGEEVSEERYDEAVCSFENVYEKVPDSEIRYVDNPHDADESSRNLTVLQVAEQLLATGRNR